MSIMDLPEAIGDVLGVSTETGGLLLSAVIIMAVMLALATLKSETWVMITGVIIFAGLLTAIGWLSQWFLVMTAIVLVTFLGVKFAKGVTA